MKHASAVPTIDIGPFLACDPQAQDVIAKQVAHTCEKTGFLIISGHRFPAALLATATEQLMAFFDQDDLTKQHWHPTGPSKQRGFHGFATRGLAHTLGQKTPPDLRESLFLGPVDDHREYYAQLPQAAASYAPNRIPTLPRGLDQTLLALYREYERLAVDLMRLFGAALGLPSGYFDGVLQRHFSVLSCHHYPVLAEAPLPDQLRTGAHTDYGAMTILASTDAQGGLEVQMPDLSWLPVQAKSGEFVVNLGDMMARWTNDRWASTLHRVVNPPLGLAQSRRLSIGMFVHPNYDQSIASVPTCIDSDHPPRYPAITAGEHIQRKIEASHLKN